jgi:two-component system, OmpR family, response regulator AdeR
MSATRADFQILMIEDTIEYATLNLLVLKKAGFKVQHAPDGETAIKYIDVMRPDVILLDLNLPRVTGWDVLKHLYSTYGEDSTRVIVTTAYSDSANKLVGKLQHIDKYLTKPFTPQDLISAIDTVLGITAN